MSGIEMVAFAAMAAQAVGTIAQGNFANQAAKSQARQMRAMALREEASSQREAMEERKASRLLASRAKAMAGASGAGIDDPTVNKILGEIDATGEYNALVAMYEGTMKARDTRFQADATREEGRSAKKASYVTAISDLGTAMWDQGAFTNSGLFGMKGTATARKV
jgi:hypothetical protein